MIETTDLGKQFDEFIAVKGINLTVGKGELLALLGPNGAGKTTTVRMLSAILRPSTGRARVAGYDVVEAADNVRQAIGMLTEQPGLYQRMTGLEYLLFYGRLYGLTDTEIKRRSLVAFDRFAMADASGRRLGTYSKGMRQKVGLIRAMLHDPHVLLLDEPTSAMDPHSAKLVRDAILALRADQRTVILCTHNLAEAELLADRIAIIRQGEIVAEGTSRQLKRQLLGEPVFAMEADRPVNGQLHDLDDLITVEKVEGPHIRYRTSVPQVNNPILVRCLGERGLGVVSLTEVTPSLEDVYLRVVGAASQE